MLIVGFSSTKKIMSRIIMWATRSKASHSYIRFDVAGEPVVIHSNQHGINCDHYDKFKKSKKIVKEFKMDLSPEQEKAILSHALKLLDTPYDFLSVVGFGWVLLCKALGCKVKNPFPNRSAYQCSEFVLRTLREAGKLDGFDHIPRERVSPEDLINILSKHELSTEI